MNKYVLAATTAFTLSAGAAQAAVIDFTKQSNLEILSDSGGTWSGEIAGFDIEITTTGGVLTFGESVAGSACSGEGELNCAIDGLGVGDDEIKGGGMKITDGQTLTLTFTDGPVQLDKLYFLDLFTGSNGAAEQATVDFDGLMELTFDATLANNGGYLSSSDGLPLIVTTLTFGAIKHPDFFDDRTNDYALAGLAVSEIPLPAAGWMLLGGLGAIGAMRARRKS
ncbi:MAG: VPLPA-CTERM sorting domain-containing protein [Rhodobacteraceae bacterium]|nr:VPLPA-CTERM sorting domain-containing protein [Paracoccaceae bacterium]